MPRKTNHTDSELEQFSDLIEEVRANGTQPATEPDWGALQRAVNSQIDRHLDELEERRRRSVTGRLRAWLSSPARVGASLAVAAAAAILLWRAQVSNEPAAVSAHAESLDADSARGYRELVADADIDFALAPSVHDLTDEEVDRALDALDALADKDELGGAPVLFTGDVFAGAVADEQAVFATPAAVDLGADLAPLSDDELDELAAIFAG
jgi:hypothetical protein